VAFGFGDRDSPNPTGRYFVGENPVIDVVVPADVQDGFIYVSVVDVSGNVFHLLPNLTRPDNSIEGLRGGTPGDLPVRIAYSLEEASGTNKLAFLIDGNTLGKSKILVLYSQAELFDGVRPTTESAASYADALSAARDNGELRVKTLDTALLTSVAP
jgi:serine/threonine-protein kinase